MTIPKRADELFRLKAILELAIEEIDADRPGQARHLLDRHLARTDAEIAALDTGSARGHIPSRSATSEHGMPPMSTTNLDTTINVVLADFGSFGPAYVERRDDRSDLESTVCDILSGDIERPLAVYALNPAEGWSRDVSAHVASEIARRAIAGGARIPAGAHDFIENATSIAAAAGLEITACGHGRTSATKRSSVA